MLRGPSARRGVAYFQVAQGKEALMSSVNQQPRPHRTGRWIAIAVVVAAVGVVLLVLYGGGGSGTGY
jgi:cobalamin biosynthesis Mg chelatase CobN